MLDTVAIVLNPASQAVHARKQDGFVMSRGEVSALPRRTAANGYAGEHPKVRAAYEAQLAVAGALPCADPAPGCPGLVYAGTRWHLAHHHVDRSQYLGLAHARCNLWWAAFLTNARRRARARRTGHVPAAGVFGPLSS